MTHIPEEQLKREPAVEKAVVKTPEVISSPHDILGKEYEFNGVSFTVLGIEPVFFGDDNAIEDLQSDTVTFVNDQKQRIPVIPFQGGMARITKIRICDEVIVGNAEILKHMVIVEQAPEGWMMNNSLAIELKNVAGAHAIKSRAETYREFHPEWFHDYKDKQEKSYEHYAPELCDILRKEFSSEEYAPEGWMTKKGISSECNINVNTCITITNNYRTSHVEWFHEYKDKGGHLREHYSPELCDLIRQVISSREYAPRGWMTMNSLTKELKSGPSTIKEKMRIYRQSNPEWFHWYTLKQGFSYEHYAPELCDILRKEFSSKEYVPEGWMTNGGLMKKLNENFDAIKLQANIYRTTNTEWFHKYSDEGGHLREYYAPELCDLIHRKLSQKESAPSNWKTREGLVKELKSSGSIIKSKVDPHRFSHPEWFHWYIPKSGPYSEHYAPELCNLIRQEIADK